MTRALASHSMNKKAVLDAAVRWGFLREINGGYALGDSGRKMKRNLISAWIRNAQGGRICFHCQSNGSGDHVEVLHQLVKHHMDHLRHLPPFAIAFNAHDENWQNSADENARISNDQGFTSMTNYNFYYICTANRSRLCFDELLRRRRNWWTEIRNRRSLFQYIPSEFNSEEKASRILPYSGFFHNQPETSECSSPSASLHIEIIEEIPKILTQNTTVSAVRSAIAIEAAILALLEDGAKPVQDSELEFRLHQEITPCPVAILRRIAKDDDDDVVDALCTKVKGVLSQVGIDYIYRVVNGEVDDVQREWQRSKASGVLYGIVIDGQVIRDGILKFLHCDLHQMVETPLPLLQLELFSRLGRIKRI